MRYEKMSDIVGKLPAKKQIAYIQYLDKYFNLFLSKYYIPELSYQENNFIFRSLWNEGRIAGKQLKSGQNIFTDFSEVSTYNYLDYPTEIQLINSRGYKFIPAGNLKVDEDVIIGYAKYSKSPIREFVDFMVDKIIDVESCLRKNLRALSTPFIIGSTVENQTKVREFIKKLDNDEDNLFFEFKSGDGIPQPLITGVPYIIDRLYNQKIAYENELLTYIGINNMGASEKKEHLITSEIEVNNDVIIASRDTVADNIQDFLDRYNEKYGTNLTLRINGGYIEETSQAESISKTEEDNDE